MFNQPSTRGFQNFSQLSINESQKQNFLDNQKRVLLNKETATNPYTYGFIALQQDSPEPYYQENPLALCIVELLGVKGEEIRVIQLSLLPCDKDRLITGILAINKVRNFGKLSMSLSTMRWFNEDRAFSRACDLAQKKEGATSFPMLSAIKDPVNLRIYQETILLPLLRKSIITYSAELAQDVGLIESLKKIGINPLAYALAGACEQAVKQQLQLSQVVDSK